MVAGRAEYGQEFDTDDHGMLIAPSPNNPKAAFKEQQQTNAALAWVC